MTSKKKVTKEEDNIDYYLSEKVQRKCLINTAKRMSKKELEEDVIKYTIQWQKLSQFIYNKKLITPSGVKELIKILGFRD